jgi:PAS domain S-box-containing protein
MKNIAFNKVSFGFATALAILAVNLLVAERNITTIAENSHAELGNDRLSLILANMQLELKDAEIAQREYLFTGNYLVLQSHQVQQIDRVQKLVRSIADPSIDRFSVPSAAANATGMGRSALAKPAFLADREPLQIRQEKLDRFTRSIDLKLKELTSFNRRKISPLPTPRQFQLSPRERQIIPQICQEIANFDRDEQSLVDRARSESQSSIDKARITLTIAGLLDLLLLAALYRLVSFDRAKQQKIESKLREDSIELEQLYHNAPCGYHSLDEMGNFTQMNRTELSMLRYEAAEIIGQKNLTDLLTPESSQKLHHLLPTIRETGSMQDLEFQMVRKDGRIVPVSSTANIVYDDRGNYLTTRVTVIDISDRIDARKQAKLSAEIAQEIRASLELDQIFKTTVEGVQQLFDVDRVLIFRLATDGSGVVIEEQVISNYPSIADSKIFDPCFRTTHYDLYQQGRISAVSDITDAGFKACYVEFLQQFDTKATMTVPIHLRDELWGLLIVHHCRSTRLWQDREIESMSQLANQIGIAISQAQLLLYERQQRQELVRSNTELDRFAYVCSHDLQEPLRMVTSYLQLLSNRYQGQLDADADEFIGYAVDGAMRMQALIQGLLGYARLSSRVQPFSIVECDRVLADAIANLQVAIHESGATISHEPLPRVWGDATQLTQVFQNLIANGIKFCGNTPPQIQICVREISGVASVRKQKLQRQEHLSLTPSSDMSAIISGDLANTPSAWCFSVEDNGIGIESEYLDRIFGIFQRLHPRTTYPGTGIGLAICQKIVERHGGKIWAESTPTQGSTFYFIIDSDSIALSSWE